MAVYSFHYIAAVSGHKFQEDVIEINIVILDGYTVNPGDLDWNVLGNEHMITAYDTSPLDDDSVIIRRAGNCEILITNKTPITAKVLDNLPALKFISVLGTGYNNVDTEHAARLRIPVSNVPGYGTHTVAQYTIGLLLELCHHAVRRSDAVHAGRWTDQRDSCYWDYPLMELDGKTIGIIGFGKIGQQTARIASAMGMHVLACSRTAYSPFREAGTYVSLETLLQNSDVVSLHCPLFPDTEKIMNRETIAQMKDGAILLNTSRGRLVDDAALADALISGKLAGAAIDVVSTEPIPPDNPLLQAPNCLITPHIAWTSPEARKRVMECTARNVSAFVNGTPVHVVNL